MNSILGRPLKIQWRYLVNKTELEREGKERLGGKRKTVLNCEDIERDKTTGNDNKLTPIAPKSLETKLRSASKTVRTRSFFMNRYPGVPISSPVFQQNLLV